MELWRDIPGYEGIYQASNLGQIRSAPGKTTSNERYDCRTWQTRILKQKWQAKGHRQDARVTLWKDGRCKDHLVARLVAMAWVGGYSPELTVNHIDGNSTNNVSSNLEWVSRSENIKKGFEIGLYGSIQSSIELAAGNEKYRFSSQAEASRFLGRCHGYIHCCLTRSHPIRDINGKEYTISNQT